MRDSTSAAQAVTQAQCRAQGELELQRESTAMRTFLFYISSLDAHFNSTAALVIDDDAKVVQQWRVEWEQPRHIACTSVAASRQLYLVDICASGHSLWCRLHGSWHRLLWHSCAVADRLGALLRVGRRRLPSACSITFAVVWMSAGMIRLAGEPCNEPPLPPASGGPSLGPRAAPSNSASLPLATTKSWHIPFGTMSAPTYPR